VCFTESEKERVLETMETLTRANVVTERRLDRIDAVYQTTLKLGSWFITAGVVLCGVIIGMGLWYLGGQLERIELSSKDLADVKATVNQTALRLDLSREEEVRQNQKISEIEATQRVLLDSVRQ
jgi:hypothetical protein